MQLKLWEGLVGLWRMQNLRMQALGIIHSVFSLPAFIRLDYQVGNQESVLLLEMNF